MSHTGTFRGTTPNKTIGRGRLPDFDGANASHIPRPRSDRPESSAASHPPSDLGSNTGTGTMSAASSRQRATQSKRDEVRLFRELQSRAWDKNTGLFLPGLERRTMSSQFVFQNRQFVRKWRPTSKRNTIRAKPAVLERLRLALSWLSSLPRLSK